MAKDGKRRSYDLIPYAKNASGEQSSIFNPSKLQGLFEELLKHYYKVVIWGRPEGHYIENLNLAKAAGECVILVDGKRTTFDEVNSAYEMLGRNRVLGSVMINT